MSLKIAWVTRSFLDYRIPVFRELSKLVCGNLYLIYSGDYVPESVQEKSNNALGENCIPLHEEWKFGSEDQYFMANKNISFRFQPGLYSKIKEIKPDVIVCDGFFKWTLPALLYKLIHRTPMVINYERTHHTERSAQWFRTLYRKLVVKFTDAMDCSGQLCVEYSKSLGMSEDKITTGHMSADTEGLATSVENITREETAALRLKLEATGTVFLFVGRLHPRKGCMEIARAWLEFQRQNSAPATLLMVGEGEQKEELEEFCTVNSLDSIRIVGRVPYDMIAVYYAVSDVFVIPTLEDNWSLVVPEAMAAGLPILCSKYNGCWPELVREGVNGWLFDPLNKEDAIEKLASVSDQKDQLEEMGKNSIEMLKNYTPIHAADSILNACNLATNNNQHKRRTSAAK